VLFWIAFIVCRASATFAWSSRSCFFGLVLAGFEDRGDGPARLLKLRLGLFPALLRLAVDASLAVLNLLVLGGPFLVEALADALLRVLELFWAAFFSDSKRVMSRAWCPETTARRPRCELEIGFDDRLGPARSSTTR